MLLILPEEQSRQPLSTNIRLAMERFPERISHSEYKDKFILKGGMLVAAMVGLDARATMDMDATVKGTDISLETVEAMIANIISVPLEDDVIFRVK